MCFRLPGAGCSIRKATVNKAQLEAGYPCCENDRCINLLAQLMAGDPKLAALVKELANKKLGSFGSSKADEANDLVSMAVQTKCIICC